MLVKFAVAGRSCWAPLVAFLVLFISACRHEPAGTTAALSGMTAGLIAVGIVAFETKVAWPWYAVVGAVVTFGSGMIASWISQRKSDASSPSARAR